jgi:hypothetical protein
MSNSHTIESVQAQMDSLIGDVVPIIQDEFAITNESTHERDALRQCNQRPHPDIFEQAHRHFDDVAFFRQRFTRHCW